MEEIAMVEVDESPKPLSYHLRNLNENCLLKIFVHLSRPDILRICGLDTENDQFFTSFVGRHFVSKWLVELDKCPNNILESFGPFFKRIKIKITELSKIIKYCSPNTIEEIHVDDRIDHIRLLVSGFDPLIEPLEPLKPYLQKVAKLTIEFLNRDFINEILSTLLSSVNLKSLTLIFTRSEIIVNPISTFKNIHVTELVLINMRFETSLAQLVQKLPHLKVLIHHGCVPHNAEVYQALIQHCPNIEVYKDICKDTNEYRCKHGHTYDFLDGFNCLKEVELTSDIDNDAYSIKSALQILARKAFIRKLTIHPKRNPNRRIEENDGSTTYEKPFKYQNGFSQLSHICFCFSYFPQSKIDPSSGSIYKEKVINLGELAKYFAAVLTGMQKLNKLTLESHDPNKQFMAKSLSSVMKCIPNIQEIDIHQFPLLTQLPVEVRFIKRFINEIIEERRREGGQEDKVRLTIHPLLLRDFNSIKNLERTIILVVKKSNIMRNNRSLIE